MENCVEFRGVSKRFRARAVLADVSLRMEGGLFGVVGREGAGKSTLVRIAATLVRQDAGEALVCGVPTERASAVRALIGYVPQDFDMYGGMRVCEAMDYLGALSRLDAATRRARTEQLLESVGLSEQAGTRVRRLDASMRRRLGVAQALMHDPRVLLVDEPFQGVEPEWRARLRALLTEAAVDRLVVLCARAASDVEGLCARVAVLEAGRVLYAGDAAALVERARGKMFLVELPEGALAEFRRRYRVVSVVEHGERRVARFIAPDGAPGCGRGDEPCLEDALALCRREAGA